MAYLIGTDEAGYGPNLGPLVVGATVWQLPDALLSEDLYQLLGPIVATKPGAGEAARRDRLVIGDSKQVYSSRLGLDLLERGVLAAAGACNFSGVEKPVGFSPGKWSEFWPPLVPRHQADWPLEPWHADFDPHLPLESRADHVNALCTLLQDRLAELEIRLVSLRAAVLFPRRFNQLVETCGNKASMLTETALGLVADLLRELPPEPANIICDKHGGRSHYAAALQHCLPDHWVDILEEGRMASRYVCRAGDLRLRFTFQQGAECHLPAALASMVAKYLREVAMQAFNEFWLKHFPQIRPTAGYPQDAKRFRAEVAAKQQALGISEEVLWRCR